MSFTAAVGAGHGKNTPGKRNKNDEREWFFNRIITESVIKQLNHNGIKTVRLDDPSGNVDVPLSERKKKGDNCDIYVSIHNNALGKWFDGGGSETYYYKGSGKGKKLASLIQKEMVDVLKRPDRGIKEGNHLYEIRETKPPAVLIEALFFDSKQDILLLRDEKLLEKLGVRIAKAICDYFGVSFKEKKEEVKKPVSNSSNAPVYRVKVDGEQIFALREKENIIKQLEKHIGSAKKIELERI